MRNEVFGGKENMIMVGGHLQLVWSRVKEKQRDNHRLPGQFV